MKNLTSDDLRQMYLDFFKSKGHTVIRSASLIPENDPTVLFTTAGMHLSLIHIYSSSKKACLSGRKVHRAYFRSCKKFFRAPHHLSLIHIYSILQHQSTTRVISFTLGMLTVQLRQTALRDLNA